MKLFPRLKIKQPLIALFMTAFLSVGASGCFVIEALEYTHILPEDSVLISDEKATLYKPSVLERAAARSLKKNQDGQAQITLEKGKTLNLLINTLEGEKPQVIIGDSTVADFSGPNAVGQDKKSYQISVSAVNSGVTHLAIQKNKKEHPALYLIEVP